ncbi:MAG: flagellar protein export ATPase FliI [Desulfobacteraceae bacterium]
MDRSTPYKRYTFPEFRTGEHTAVADGTGSNPDGDFPSGQDLATLESEAYEEGYAEGQKNALPQEHEKLRPVMDMLDNATAIINDHHAAVIRNTPGDVVDLAMAMARKIIFKEMEKNGDGRRDALRHIVKLAVSHDNAKIRCHPDDEQSVKSALLETLPDTETSNNFELILDKGIQPGGCLVDTDFGTVDARIDKQLDSIEAELKQVVVSLAGSAEWTDPHFDPFEQFREKVDNLDPIQSCGHVTQVVGLVVEANGPVTQLGCVCDIYGKENEAPVKAEVLGFRDQTVLLMPLEEIRSISPGSRVVARQKNAAVAVGEKLLGRVIDGLGAPMDGLGAIQVEEEYPIYANPINPLLRQRIRKPLDIGVRAINGLLTVGGGQRMGIFAGSGVGKSTLMGIIARKSQADVNVIALIGERGRELNEFIDKELGEEGLKKSVVVVATSDHLPLVRVRGAFVATAIAEFFRDQGMQVNLMMDSLTRFAMAQREIGLALGEPPTTKGYTPSVFTLLPKLLERAGTSDHHGAITGLYTVLVEGDDMNEPIADAARSILDGHIVLTRELADQNHYPAIDVLKSVSRVMVDITGLQHKHDANRLKELLATYRKAEDLVNIGAYVNGSNPKIDQAIERIELINQYLRQDITENVHFEESLEQLNKIMDVAAVSTP